jgi:hypothetical protein
VDSVKSVGLCKQAEREMALRIHGVGGGGIVHGPGDCSDSTERVGTRHFSAGK